MLITIEVQGFITHIYIPSTDYTMFPEISPQKTSVTAIHLATYDLRIVEVGVFLLAGWINLQVHACNNGERQSKMMKNEPMNAEKKKRDLYLRQKQLLDTFLEHGAISRAQYDKSLGDLTVKMGFGPETSGQ